MDIINSVKTEFNKKRYNLIETLANNIKKMLFNLYDLKYIKICIRKSFSQENQNYDILIELEETNE